jgi:hypothetical protein
MQDIRLVDGLVGREQQGLSGIEKGTTDLTRFIHERFCCNRRSAAATGLRPAGSHPLPHPPSY